MQENIQHYMSSHPDFNNISIDDSKRYIFMTLMISDGLYIIQSLNQLNMEVISNIQCYFFKRKKYNKKEVPGNISNIYIIINGT